MESDKLLDGLYNFATMVNESTTRIKDENTKLRLLLLEVLPILENSCTISCADLELRIMKALD